LHGLVRCVGLPIYNTLRVRTVLLVGILAVVLVVMAALAWSIFESWRWQKRVVEQNQPLCVSCNGRLPYRHRSNDFRVVCLDDGCLVVRQRMFFQTVERYRLCPDRNRFQITARSSRLEIHEPSSGASIFIWGRSGERLSRALEGHGWLIEHI